MDFVCGTFMQNGDVRPLVTGGGSVAIGHYRGQFPLKLIVC